MENQTIRDFMNRIYGISSAFAAATTRDAKDFHNAIKEIKAISKEAVDYMDIIEEEEQEQAAARWLDAALNEGDGSYIP